MMLAVVLAAGTLTAEDTARIRSYRTVDVCSGEKRFTIAIDLGLIVASDSLVSFDITIGYDTLMIRPTDVLKEGTLSSQMQYGPVFTKIVPGEMRVAGFNVLRPVIGSVPLFAIAGDYLGDCGSIASFTTPWPHEFNEEFKRRFTTTVSDTIATVAVGKHRQDLGTVIAFDTLEIPGKDSVRVLDVKANVIMGSVSKYEMMLITSDSVTAIMENVTLVGVTNQQFYRDSPQRIRVEFETDGMVDVVAQCSIRSTTAAKVATQQVRSELKVIDSCHCVKSTSMDSVQIVSKQEPVVSVASPVDARIERLIVANNIVYFQCDHGQTNVITVSDLLGRVVLTTTSSQASNPLISLEHLPAGTYIINAECGRGRFTKLNVK